MTHSLFTPILGQRKSKFPIRTRDMVEATIYFVYLPSKNLNAVGWIMHIFKFDNRREFFFCTVRQEIRGQRDRNPIFNLGGVSNESE